MSPSPGLDIRFFAAPAAFADCFSAIYRLEIALPEGESVSDLLLPEWGNLRFISAGSPGGVELDGQHFGAGSFFATGPTSRAKRISVGAIRLWGIGLLPLGWANFVRAPASQLADGVFDGARHPAFAHFARCLAALEQVEGDDLAEYAVLCEALAELARPPRDEARIRNAQQAMADPYLTQIPDFADRTGVSVRSLERVCLKYFGFSPNIMLRRQRLIRSLSAFVNGGEALWREAIDRHYHDQPHFVREFRQFVGMSPGEYARLNHPVMQGFASIRQQVWGKPARDCGPAAARRP